MSDHNSSDGTSSHSPEISIAESPFDDPNADVVLRTSDNVDFHVFKMLLSMLSPVFRDIFALPQTDDQKTNMDWKDGKPVVRMTEDSHTIERLLKWCDPGCRPVLESLDDIQVVLEAATKYDMEPVENHIAVVLKTTSFIEEEPVRVFAVACRYKMEDLARLAAKHTLKQPLSQRPNVKELQHISATALQHLHEYYFACGRAASSVARGSNFPWVCFTPIWVWVKTKIVEVIQPHERF